MSAIGKKIAVVSLGLSCQTSRQIDGHVPLLRELTGDAELQKASLPLDWLISTAAGLEGLLSSGKFFPETAGELVADQHRLRLRSHDIFYWHESRLYACEGHRGFEDVKAKYRFTSGRFEQIAGLQRVVAVVSDTQPNLPEIEEQWGIRLLSTPPAELQRLRAAFEKFLGRSVELIVVSRDRQAEAVLGLGIRSYHMEPAAEGWAGNAADWALVFRDYFSRPAPEI